MVMSPELLPRCFCRRFCWPGMVFLLLLVSCQSPVQYQVSYLSDVRYAADADSLSLAHFLGLADHERLQRRLAADRWRQQAQTNTSMTQALQALHSAVGLNPADALAWLHLASRRRWYGDYQQTEDALDAGRAALPHQALSRRMLAAGFALCEAWLRYDRGEWRRGLAAVDSAAAHGADSEAIELLRALHLSGQGHDSRARDIARRFARRDHRAHWIYGISYWRRGGIQAAHSIFNGLASQQAAGPGDFVRGPMKPTGVGASECYRDFGTVEELLGNWWLAARKFHLSARALPYRDQTILSRVDHPILGRDRAGPSMPVWLAFDRYFVTGSLSAYAALAYARFRAADERSMRDIWASMVLDAAGICVRLNIDAAWARRVRGLVLATFEGQQELARQDLEAAQRWFDRRRIDDVQTLTTLGRLHLSSSRYSRAKPLLHRAVHLVENNARLWSDLGLVHIHLGERESAMKALNQALSLDENLAVAWYNRGLLRFHQGDLPGAVADLEQALVLEPEDLSIKKLLNQLRQRL